MSSRESSINLSVGSASLWAKRKHNSKRSKLFTAIESLILGIAGYLSNSKLAEVTSYIFVMLSAWLDDGTF
jgi:hypothetical protein